MLRRTLGSVRNDISRVMQQQDSPNLSIVVNRINEAQERLINKGKWAGLKVRYAFCAYNNCITLPREIESILALAIDSNPRRVNNQWYEFMESGTGISEDGSGFRDANDMGSVVTFKDICGSKYIAVYSDAVEDVEARILIKGYNSSGNRVMTYDNQTLIDGEYISLYNARPNISVNQFAQIDSVVKPITKASVRLYQHNGASSQSCIAIYDPSEEFPIYRRYRINGLATPTSDGVNTTLSPHTVTVLGKRRFIPVVNDNDELLISNIAALKNMVQAIEHEEAGTFTFSKVYEQNAIDALNDELKEWQGGSRAQPNVILRGFGVGDIHTII